MSSGAPMRASLPYLVLGAAVLAVSNGAIFARLSDAAPLATAAWRLTIASSVIVPLALLFGRTRFEARARDWCLAAVAGGLLALHFATWITSLEYTSIANSVLLVTTAPIWVGLLSLVTGRDRPGPRWWVGMSLAMLGAAVITLGGVQAADGSTLGDVLALAGAICMAGYLMLAREAQRALPLLPYLATAYGTAGLVLWIAVVATGTAATGFTATTWMALGGMAVVSQLLGHSGYNWSLRHLPPAFVAVTLLAEPLVASALGWLLLGEAVTVRTLLGGAVVLAGIVVATRSAR